MTKRLKAFIEANLENIGGNYVFEFLSNTNGFREFVFLVHGSITVEKEELFDFENEDGTILTIKAKFIYYEGTRIKYKFETSID